MESVKHKLYKAQYGKSKVGLFLALLLVQSVMYFNF